MAKWRYFAERELPRVIRDLQLPAALPPRNETLRVCPLHRERLGLVTRMCDACHRTAWDEIGRRYREQGRPVRRNSNPDLKEDTHVQHRSRRA